LIEELLEFAEHSFKLSKTDQHGVTEREHLEEVERQAGKTPQALIGPQFPTLVSHIWSAFVSLSSARTAGMSGPNPITYPDIQAWLTLTNQVLSPRDIEAIKLLDSTYLRTQHG